MKRFICVASLFLTLRLSSCLELVASQNSGRTLKQGINEAQGVSSSASPPQNSNKSAMSPVESPPSSNDPTLVSSESPSGRSSVASASTTGAVSSAGILCRLSQTVGAIDAAVAVLPCSIPRKPEAKRKNGRMYDPFDTENGVACCESCRGVPNSECLSWWRGFGAGNKSCYLSSNP